MRRPPSRRAVLAGGAALAALSGCGTPRGDQQPTPAPENPEHALLRELIADKERVIGLYTTLVAGGAGKLRPFLDRHQAHLSELRVRYPATAAATPSTAPPSQQSAQKISLTRLRDVERKAAAQRPRQLAGASPALAQLIASIGTCEALHVLSLPRSL